MPVYIYIYIVVRFAGVAGDSNRIEYTVPRSPTIVNPSGSPLIERFSYPFSTSGVVGAQMLEEDAIRFDTFLKENDKKAHEAIKKAERETKVTRTERRGARRTLPRGA